ncbi:MAG: hypothetical protein OWR62_15630 [Sulfobacillus thermotolerans]|nr:hypothetical protein [Sulfobacillus thermotolerans]
MFIGYARVSTAEQTLALQEDALQLSIICTTPFQNVISCMLFFTARLMDLLSYGPEIRKIMAAFPGQD